jgi:hypothetical protein
VAAGVLDGQRQDLGNQSIQRVHSRRSLHAHLMSAIP